MYMTFIRTIILHGLETRALSKTAEVRLDVFKRKVHREIYDPYHDP